MRTLLSLIVWTAAAAFIVDAVSSKNLPTIKQGSGGIGVAFDVLQSQDDEVPVRITRVRSSPGERDENGNRPVFIRDVLVENRSIKTVSSVIFRLMIGSALDRDTVLKRVELEPVKKEVSETLLPGERRTYEFSNVMIFDLVKDIPVEKNPSNKFQMVVAINEVVFADGSTWKETSQNTLYHQRSNP